MLLKYGAENFCCFKEGVEVSFELSSNCPAKISKNKNVSNLLCVKGANGSGKTNLLKIISFLGNFCTNSFNEKPEESISAYSYFDNDQPIKFYCDFKIKETEYYYDITLNKDHIISESISRKIKQTVSLFERDGNKLTKSIKQFSELHKIKLRSNASIISTANQYDFEAIKPIYRFFSSILANVGPLGRLENQHNDSVSRFYHHNAAALKFSIDLIKKSDVGINNIAIHTRKDEKENKIFFPIFEHDTDAHANKLTFYDQSSGTKELYNILPYYRMILDTGGVLVLDEFDINLHPHILPLLIQLFDDEKTNPYNAQMIFSTHHDSILDYMGKYRTIVVNKEKSGSYSFRLDEISGDVLRNDRSIRPVYNAGKITGVPRL
ncbi:MAG: ATP-binding protein [Candidatus Electrothrix aestuarii]|uniref:ATP-binding protein n=1 Tax=Candidatus Electrothrix aestuarii TaxID=3062594 RepID=A0AAU8LVY0_9BACT|nr:ATP-binding protein [Candidatus Electrothrix aestuarii]